MFLEIARFIAGKIEFSSKMSQNQWKLFLLVHFPAFEHGTFFTPNQILKILFPKAILIFVKDFRSKTYFSDADIYFFDISLFLKSNFVSRKRKILKNKLLSYSQRCVAGQLVQKKNSTVTPPQAHRHIF